MAVFENRQPDGLLLQAMMESMTGGVFIIKGTRFFYVNPAFERFTGYSREELARMDLWDIIESEHRDSVRDTVLTCQNGNGLPKMKEVKVLTRTGEVRWMELAISVVEYETEAMLMGSVTDISERKQMEEELRASEEKFHKSFHDLPNLMAITTLDGTFKEINDAFTEILGYGRDEVIGGSVLEYAWIDPEDRREYVDRLQQYGFVRNMESFFRKKTGEKIAGLISGVIVTVEGIDFILTTMNDITQRTQMEEELRASEEKFNQAFHSLPVSMSISSMDGFFQDINSTFLENTGYTREEIIGASAFDKVWTSPRARGRVIEGIRKRGYLRNLEIPLITKTGEKRTGLMSSVIIKAGGVEYLLTSVNDITQRKRMEEELRASEEKFNQAFHSLPVSMSISSMDGVFREVNSTFLETFGYSRDEVIGGRASEMGWVRPEEREIVIDEIKRKGSLRNREMPFRSGSGDTVFCLVSSVIIKAGGEEYLLTSGIDITQNKQAEEELRASEEKFNQIFQELPVSLAIGTMSGVFMEVNSTFTKMFGCTREEVIGRRPEDFAWVYPEDRRLFDETLKREGAVLNYEGLFKRKTGETFNGLLSGIIIKIKGSEYLLTNLNDITQRKKAEEELRASEEKFNQFFRELPVPLAINGPGEIFLEANSALLELFGYSREELIGHRGSDLVWVNQEEHDAFDEIFFRDGRVQNFEAMFQKKNGETFTGLLSGVQIDINGEHYSFTNMNNIYKRKKAEEELRASEEKFNKAFHELPIPLALHSAPEFFLEVNNAFLELYGYSREELIGRNSADFIWVYPEQQKEFDKILKRDRLVRNFEAAFRIKSGETRHGLLTGIVIDIMGKNYVLTNMNDITQRKKAEEELKDSEEKFNTAFQVLPVSMAISDMQGVFQEINSAFTELMGYTREDVIGQVGHDLVWAYPEERKGFSEMLRRDGMVRNYEKHFKRKAGPPGIGLLTAVIIKIKGTEYLLSNLNDITDRKQAEEDLKASERKFNRAFHDLPNAMVITSREGVHIEVNAAMCDMLGLSREELIGNISVNTGWISREDRKKIIQTLDGGGVVQNMEVSLRRKQGDDITALISAVYIEIAGERYVLSTFNDITRRKQAEEATQTVLSGVMDAIFIHDLEGRLAYVNENALKMCGVDAEKALKYTVADYSAPDNRFDAQARLWRRVMEGEAHFYEWNLRRPKDGSVIPVEVYHCRIVLDGEVLIMAMVRDITERKRAERMLKEASDRLADSYRRLQQANDELEDKVASRTEELVALNEELTAINDELVGLNLDLAKEIEERRRVEATLENTNHELSQALENLRNTQDQLVQSEKMASLGTLVAGVAHEISSPIGVGVTAASHLERTNREFYERYQEGKINPEDLESCIEDNQMAVKIILSNLERAARLVKSFKQVSSDLSYESQRFFNIRDYLDEILLSMQPRLRKTRLTVDVRCDDDLIVFSYPGAFSQIITNLIMNTLLHAYEPGESGEVKIEARKDGQEIVLAYSDNGRGMDRDTLGKVFDPFFTTKRGAGGTGLGLYIVYNLVSQQFHGAITCSSSPGRGTTFTIRLKNGLESHGPSLDDPNTLIHQQ